MTVLEALRAGVPIVASRIGGIPELVEDGVTGILVQPGDLDALASAICRCLKDDQLRARAKQYGPITVCERFSRDVMISRFEKLYLA
jgi:glycosyltransferase involved in cell wall biosynthesis